MKISDIEPTNRVMIDRVVVNLGPAETDNLPVVNRLENLGSHTAAFRAMCAELMSQAVML